MVKTQDKYINILIDKTLTCNLPARLGQAGNL